MASILHISADIPDAFAPRKTAAVPNLLTLVPRHEHRIYSLNRIDGIGGAIEHIADPGCICLTYRAPPFGVMLRPHLDRLADWIADDAARSGRRFDAVHGHKLAVEGLLARRVAGRLGVPYAVSLWGNTDQRFVARKPGLRAAYRRVVHEARVVTPAAPWIARALAGPLDLSPDACQLLPIVSTSDAIIASPLAGRRILSVFNLDYFRAKGAPALVAAIARLNRTRPATPVRLDIAGGGSAKARDALEALIRRTGAASHVRMLGAVAHAEIQQLMAGYAAFALPTLSETYGMVYVEALLAGVPVLYSRERGIDGYLDGLDIGYRCNPGDPDDIANGLGRLVDGEAAHKARVRSAQQAGQLSKFQRPAIATTYERIIGLLTAPA